MRSTMTERRVAIPSTKPLARRLGWLLLGAASLAGFGACASIAGLSQYAEDRGADAGVGLTGDAFAPGAGEDAPGASPGSSADDAGDEAAVMGADAGDDSTGESAGDDVGDGASGGDAAGTGTPADAASDGSCGDVTSDKKNCGTCGHVCTTSVAHGSAACVNSACTFTCTSGYSACGGACVDQQSDEGNCGGCGYVCATGTTCSAGQCTEPSKSAFVCVTSLAHAPVCDSSHHYCLCTDDSDCNSDGLNVVANGGCNSGHCGGGQCSGGQNTDSVGCAVVAITCNLGGTQGCPAKTVCEVNHGGCGGSAQCCWCTSDSACPVSGKCVNDPTQNQCNGQGPCTGSGTSYDGMHCQLGSPGIPLCATQYSCSVGNCNNVTTSAGSCSAAGTPCWCTADAQCPSGGCASWAGCAAGACTGEGQTDAFNCVR
jgi:hypothetical protein